MATVTPNIIAHESPNCGARRGGAVPSLVVLHYTAMDNVDEVLARLCDAEAEVSAHYLITRAGVIYQLVAESGRAWHAGVGQWGAITDVNSHSIGVELMNSGAPDYPEYPVVQMRALAGLLHGILARWRIAPKGVIGHSDMAVGRKSDPGPRFDWQGLARQGLSVWVAGDAGVAVDWDGFMADARAFGYCPVSDDLQGFSEVLTAFRLRFAPHETGDLNTRDMGMMRALAREFSC